MIGARPTRQPRGATLLDAIIVLAALLLLCGGVLPIVTCRSRETANRVKCASQLKQIAEAMGNYARDNGGAYPRAAWDGSTAAATCYSGSTAQDTFAPAVQKNDVTAALFMLVRGKYAATDVFYCTSSNATPWTGGASGGNVADFANFPSRAHLSYAINNPYMPANAERHGHRWDDRRSAEFAIAADMSPGGPAMGTVPLTASAKQMKAVNSPNHDGDGQNVLFGDHHVEFLQNPFVGVLRDHIFTAAAEPVVRGIWIDSHIIPTFLDGPQPPAPAARYLSGAWPLAWIGLGGLIVAALLLLVIARLPGNHGSAGRT